MTFVLFKIAWAVLRPGNLIAIMLVLGVAMAGFGAGRWRILGRTMITAATVALVCLLVLPIGSWVTAPLETRVAPAVLPEGVDGIVILGGSILPSLSDRHELPAINEAGERLWAGLTLARRFPQARIIYSGGGGHLFAPDLKEAEAARRMFAALGFSGPRFLFENESRNTRENAAFSKELAKPQPGQNWILVTSAAHMPRSLAVFEAIDWTMLAWPIDFRTHAGEGMVADMVVSDELDLLEYGLREWLGLAAYRLRGWTRSFWPVDVDPQPSG